MDQVDEIQNKTDIVALISEYVTLKKAGRNYKGLCPFHSEKTPSFMVSPERQIFKCFGCGQGGNVYNFLMGMESMSFGEALRSLANRCGVELLSYKPTKEEGEKERLYQANHLASEYYHYLLTEHSTGKKALDYILGRGITRESINLFKIGYAPINSMAICRFLVNKRGFKLEELQKAGLAAQGSFRDFLRDRLVFPLKDHRGNVLGFSGRAVGKWDENSYGPKYLNTPETLIYHKGDLLYGLETTKNEIKKANEVILTEGELDLISSYQAGVKNVVAIKGSALTDNQVKLLKRFCDKIIFALDTDLAGDKAARRGIEIAENFGMDLAVVKIPNGKDPDELAQKEPEIWVKVVKNAISVYQFFIESALARYDVNSPDGKRKIGAEVLPILSKISDDILKDFFLRKLANALGVSQEALVSQMSKTSVAPTPTAPLVKKEEVQKNSARRDILENYLLSLCLQGKEYKKLTEEENVNLFRGKIVLKIINLIKEFLIENEKMDIGKFAEKLPAELLEIFNHFYLADFDKIEDNDWFLHEIEKKFKELVILNLTEDRLELAKEIKKLESEGNEEELQTKEEEFQKLTIKLKKL